MDGWDVVPALVEEDRAGDQHNERDRSFVVRANLSGFDGSPESLRGLQLEYGAENGRAVVNFDGPIALKNAAADSTTR